VNSEGGSREKPGFLGFEQRLQQPADHHTPLFCPATMHTSLPYPLCASPFSPRVETAPHVTSPRYHTIITVSPKPSPTRESHLRNSSQIPQLEQVTALLESGQDVIQAISFQFCLSPACACPHSLHLSFFVFSGATSHRGLPTPRMDHGPLPCSPATLASPGAASETPSTHFSLRKEEQC
jgi:hypothetical protein